MNDLLASQLQTFRASINAYDDLAERWDLRPEESLLINKLQSELLNGIVSFLYDEINFEHFFYHGISFFYPNLLLHNHVKGVPSDYVISQSRSTIHHYLDRDNNNNNNNALNDHAPDNHNLDSSVELISQPRLNTDHNIGYVPNPILHANHNPCYNPHPDPESVISISFRKYSLRQKYRSSRAGNCVRGLKTWLVNLESSGVFLSFVWCEYGMQNSIPPLKIVILPFPNKNFSNQIREVSNDSTNREEKIEMIDGPPTNQLSQEDKDYLAFFESIINC